MSDYSKIGKQRLVTLAGGAVKRYVSDGIEVLTARAEAAEARERALKDTTDELRNLRKQYSLVVGDNIRLRGVVDSMKSSRAEIERETLERAVEACKAQSDSFLSPEYATGQPLSSFQERFACDECEAAIRAMIEEKTDE